METTTNGLGIRAWDLGHGRDNGNLGAILPV